MANITITQVDNTITANSTTDVINVTETTSNIIVSSTTIAQTTDLTNVTVPISSNSNITTTANIQGSNIISDNDIFAVDATLTGDISAVNISAVNATFTGTIEGGAFTGDIQSSAADIANLRVDANLTIGNGNTGVAQTLANSYVYFNTKNTFLEWAPDTAGYFGRGNLKIRYQQLDQTSGPNAATVYDLFKLDTANVASQVSTNRGAGNGAFTFNEETTFANPSGTTYFTGDVNIDTASGSKVDIDGLLDVTGNIVTDAYFKGDGSLLTDNVIEVTGGTNTVSIGGTREEPVVSVKLNPSGGIVAPTFQGLEVDTDVIDTQIGLYRGNLDVDVIEANSLVVSGTANVSGDMYVDANLDVTGDVDVTGDTNITGNLYIGDDVIDAGNATANLFQLNTAEVVASRDLRSRDMYMGYGQTASVGKLYHDRGTGNANAYIRWNENDGTGGAWQFSPDNGSTVYYMVRSTDELTEGSTNLYYTTARANSAITTYLGDNTNSPFVINGNLQVQGNIDYVNVEDLLVNDQSITLNYGNASALDAFIYVDRTGSTLTNAHIKWNETADQWEFFDGTSTVVLPSSTTDLVEGDNLYYTTDRANTAIDNYTGSFANANIVNTNDVSLGGQVTLNDSSGQRTLIKGKISRNAVANGDSGTLSISYDANSSSKIELSNSAIGLGQVRIEGGNSTVGVGADFNIQGLLLRSNVTQGASNAAIRINPLENAGNIDIREPVASNSNITTSEWFVGNVDGQVNDISNFTTTDLTEGTNLYYTDARARAAISSSDTNIEYDNGTGVFTMPNALVDVNSVASESGSALTVYGQSGIELDQLVDSTQSKIVDINTDGYSIAVATPPASFDIGDKIPSVLIFASTVSGTNTIAVSDIAQNGYGFAGLKLPAFRGPAFSTQMTGTSLANVMTGIGINVPFVNTGTNGINNPAEGLLGQDKGWDIFNLDTSSTTDLFPANAYVTGISGDTITMSENAIATQTASVPGGTGRVILRPGMASTAQTNVIVKYFANVVPASQGANAELVDSTLYGKLSTFEQPESLSNVTFDAISYGNVSSVTMDSVTMKNISDFEGSDESTARFRRGLLIGPSTTPDTASARFTTNNPSTLGVILESDGETFTGNSAPAPRFLINNYSGALDDLTEYPTWAFLGATGDIAKDLQQVKAPSLTLKSFRGAKSDTDNTNLLLQSGDVVGKIEFRPAATTGTGFQGTDYFNPPAAITVDVGDANIGAVANAYMHITTTPAPGTNLGYMRNNTDDTNGANQQTNFTTKDGNVTIGAKVDGMISLAPTPDYGDASNATVWTRYPGTTHEYHRFMDAGFGDKTNKTGTTVVIQPASGTTTGSGGLGYDSVGDATLAFNVHESNSTLKRAWDITAEQSSGNLLISDNTTGTPDTFMHLDGDRVFIDKSLRLQNLTTTEINAIASPESGDMVYNTTLNQVCFYNGSAWQKITSATM